MSVDLFWYQITRENAIWVNWMRSGIKKRASWSGRVEIKSLFWGVLTGHRTVIQRVRMKEDCVSLLHMFSLSSFLIFRSAEGRGSWSGVTRRDKKRNRLSISKNNREAKRKEKNIHRTLCNCKYWDLQENASKSVKHFKIKRKILFEHLIAVQNWKLRNNYVIRFENVSIPAVCVGWLKR